MKDFIITCSSTCDMNPYFLRKHNMYYVSFYYYLDGKKYYDNFFKEHSVSEFYENIQTQDVKTSQPDPEQYRDLWNKLIDQGNDILHIELDSGISGAMNSALIAKSMVEEQKKDAVTDKHVLHLFINFILSLQSLPAPTASRTHSSARKVAPPHLQTSHVQAVQSREHCACHR